MDDVLQSSSGEQTGQLTIEKVTLGQDPPYMEIKTKAENAYSTSVKENIPPSEWSSHQELQTNPAKEEGFGLSLPLGEEYERKKQRLQEELRQDYRRYMAQERLRNGRKNECKVLHKGQNGEKKMQNMTDVSQQAKVVADGPRIWAKPSEKPQSRRDAATLTESGWETPSYQRRGRRERRSWALREERDSEPGSSEEELHLLARRQLRARHERRHAERRRHRLSYRPTRRERASSADYEEDYRETNRKSLSVSPKPTLQEPEPTMSSQRSKSAASKDEARFATGLMIGGAAEDHLVRQQRKDRYRQELLDQIAEQRRNKRREKELGLMVAATGAVDPDKLPDRIRQFSAVTQDHNGSKREVPSRMGVDTLHGAKEKPLPVMDEQSPPERPSAAFQSPVLDNSITLPPVAGRRAAGPAGGGLSGHNEDIHKSLSSTLGEIVALRMPAMPAVPPPVLPMLADSYRTPYDNAYYYYGARNPLAPALVPSLHHGELPGSGEYPTTQVNPLPGLFPPTQQGRSGPQVQVTGEADPVPGGMGTGAFPGMTAQKSNYQEALKQQIREREELRKQEEDERQNHEAKLARDMEAYNPWGRGGGGAPLRDSQGNLVADLKQMHKFNKEAYLNLNSQDKQTVLLAARTISTPEAEDQPTSPQRTSGVSFAQTSPFARGNVFPELSERQKVHGQEKYKDDLRKQIEEKRRKEAEERERLRMQEEKEEKRVAEELAKMRREYEEEQEKRRRKEREMMRQAEEWRKQREEEKKKREEEEEEDKRHREKRSELPHSDPQARKDTDARHTSRPPSAGGRCAPSAASASSRWVSGENAENESEKHEEGWRKAEEEKSKKEKRHRELLRFQSKRDRQVWVEERRESSPPVPALRKKLSTRHTTRPPSAESHRAPSALSKSSGCAPQSPQEPSGRNPPKSTEERGGVIGELSVLRRLLRDKQRQLEEELLQTKVEEGDASNAISAPRHKKHHPMDVFHISRPVAVRRTPQKAAEATNLQNILDFNKLKYRDTESREEVRRLYPDPPGDDRSLDIQQRALIREQQRRINRLRNTGSADDLSHKSKNIENPTKDLVRSSLLTSESAFFEPEEGTSQRLAREQRRLANWTDPDRELGSPKQLMGQTDFDSPHSEASLRMKEHRKQRMTRLQELKDQGWLDELDTSNEDGDLPLHTVEMNLEGRQSVDTVATEPWLRPGTSEHLKQVMTRQRHKPPSRNLSKSSWEDPSTYPS
ncbi:centrosome and spindle pole associated protein 1-like isoform X3 [Scleropages formosus]|uniref:centrosome and spindle pole associated protein 1-like isoform X3 n=1 Tax=Scleropages formosus TaxID=113540 RepID=UPI0010FA8065|nr:centrosome and spindle pole associated protein 1 isoform X3 [Scleropages formosus]